MNVLSKIGYNIILILGFCAAWPHYAFRMWRRGEVWRCLGQRLGFYPKEAYRKLSQGSDLWIHAVSVGEVMIASILIEELRKLRSDLKIVLTTTTSTGYRTAQRQIGEAAALFYKPIDFFWSTRWAFALFRPRKLILIEAEVWPNLVWEAKRRGIPVYLVNARLSRRTQKRYQKWRGLVAPVLDLVDLVLAQDAHDMQRLAQAGFAQEKIFCAGSLKYDVADHVPSGDNGIEAWWSRLNWDKESLVHPVLLGGSTHAGEEELLISIWASLRKKLPSLKLILAPRHAERGSSVAAMARSQKAIVWRRSELESLAGGQACPDILVLDSTGELRSLYSKATVVFVGKSLTAHGGQNFLEAVRAGAPVMVGPYMENFSQLCETFVNAGGIVQVQDGCELQAKAAELLESEEKRLSLCLTGHEIFIQNLGAAKRTAEILVFSFGS